MIGFYASGAMGQGSGPPPVPVTYIDGTFHVDQTSASPTLAVPGAAMPGDTVVAILRCRADRTMSGFTGWSTRKDQVVRSTNPASNSFARVYILQRTLGAEASFTFSQSTSAGYGAALLVFRGGAIVTDALPDTMTSTLTKASSSSLLLAVSFGNGGASPPGSAVVSGFTRRGVTSFLSGAQYFFVSICETRAGVAAGSVSVTGTYQDGSASAAVYLAEIG